MGIEQHIDAYLDGNYKPGSIKEPVDLVTVMALAQRAGKNRGNAMDLTRKGGCLTDDELAAFLEMKKKYPGYDRAVRHMARCASCRSKAFELARLLSGDEALPPAGLVEKAFADAKAMAQQRPAAWRRYFIPLTAAAAVIVTVSAVLYQTIFMPKPGIAYVTYVAGRVELIRGGRPVVPAIKLALNNADVIRTGSGSFMLLQVDESIVIRIMENSKVDMKSILNMKNRGLMMSRGKVLSKVQELTRGYAYSVRTPMVVVSVRGTEFSVSYEPGRAVVAVRRGEVEVETGTGREKAFVREGTTMTFTEGHKSRGISASESLELENISKIPVIDGIAARSAAEIRDLMARLLGKEGMPQRTLEEMRAKYGRIDTVTLYNGRVIEGVILSRGEKYTILTTAGTITVPERQIRATQVR